jgi:hypothetical protein
MASETTLGGLRMRDDFEDKEPRIRDLELAKRLGYANVYNIRKLIEGLHNAKKLSGCVVFSAAKKTSGGRPGSEYWLDEHSSLKVIAKSDMDPADLILDEMIDVFMAYRRGKLVPRLLAEEPCEWDRMWPKSLIVALCALYKRPYDGGSYPFFLQSPQRKIYCLVIEPHNYAKVKKRNPHPSRGSNHHQWLTEQARAKFAQHLNSIETTALLSTSVHEFWKRMEACYLKHPLQLQLMGLAAGGA